jgi:hypothetical protein
MVRHAEFEAHADHAAFEKELAEHAVKEARDKHTARVQAATSMPKVNLAAEVEKVQAQLLTLEEANKDEPIKHYKEDVARAEKTALKGDSVFERKLAAAALKLELSQKKLLEQEHDMSAAAKCNKEKAAALSKDETPFYWVHTPSADEKTEPAQLKQTQQRRLLKSEGEGAECKFEAWIAVPNSAAFDARIDVLKKTNIGLVERGMKHIILQYVEQKNVQLDCPPPTHRHILARSFASAHDDFLHPP